jgi:hypothetical protein
MNYHDLEKTKVTDLREMAKEYSDLKGVSGMKKQTLVDTLAEKLGIEQPHKVVTGIDKSAIKAEIRGLKKVRDAAIEAKDREKLHDTRRQLHRLRRNLRKATRIAG